MSTRLFFKMLPSTHNKNKKRNRLGRKRKVIEEMNNEHILLGYDPAVCHDGSANGGVWFASVRRSILANCWVTEPVSVTKFFGDVGKRRRRGFFKIFSWKWSRIRSSGTRKELPSHQLNSRISSSNRLLRQPCLYVDTTFRNSIELSRYGHFTANPATREPRVKSRKHKGSTPFTTRAYQPNNKPLESDLRTTKGITDNKTTNGGK